MTEGYISLYRELLDKPIWLKSPPEHCKILITLLLMANHSEKTWEWQGERYTVNPGQFITSLDSIVKRSGAGITTQHARTALKNFEKYNFLTNQSTKRGRLITIVNWHLYQVQIIKTNKATNKDLTKTSQRPNKDLTTNNNVIIKECNNISIINNTNKDLENEIKNYTNDLELIKAITDFLDHRRVLKKPVKTIRALQLIFKELDKHTDKIGVIEQSIANGWQGLFELKTQKQHYFGNPFD